MRDANIYAVRRAMPRMSWHPRNLYNLWLRSVGSKKDEIDFRHTTLNLFQQRWKSKALVRAYHGDYINEKVFKRWYLPSTLPDVRPHASSSSTNAEELVGLARWSRREQVAEKEQKRAAEERKKGLAPVGSLMFTEVERRIDVIIFRACLAHSVYDARRLVIHGHVLLNGRKHSNPNTRLAPGDLVTVDPEAIQFLQANAVQKKVSELDAEAESDVVAAERSASEESSEAESEGEGEEGASDREGEPKKAKFEPYENALRWQAKKSKKTSHLTPFHPPSYSAPFMFVPAYLEPSFATCSVVYVRHPTARPGYSEIPTPYDADGEVVRAAWEWYSKSRPRMRSKSQLARMPENRQ